MNFICISGKPVLWTFNGKQLPNNAHSLKLRESSRSTILEIKNPQITNEGSYECNQIFEDKMKVIGIGKLRYKCKWEYWVDIFEITTPI